MLVQSCPKCSSQRVQRAYDDTVLLLRVVGINLLLCNNCNAEFKGFSLFGGKRSRGRKIEIKHRPKVGSTQRAPRKRARLTATIHLQDERSDYFQGYTRDVSRIGLSLVLPDARFTDDYLALDKHRLLIHLAIPTSYGTSLVVLHATAVRFEQLDDEEMLTGWLVGARITSVKSEDRERFMRYLDSIK